MKGGCAGGRPAPSSGTHRAAALPVRRTGSPDQLPAPDRLGTPTPPPPRRQDAPRHAHAERAGRRTDANPRAQEPPPAPPPPPPATGRRTAAHRLAPALDLALDRLPMTLFGPDRPPNAPGPRPRR